MKAQKYFLLGLLISTAVIGCKNASVLISGLTVTNSFGSGLSGTGTSGYFPYFTSSTSVAPSVVFTDGTNVGIGTTTPGATLDITGYFKLKKNSSAPATCTTANDGAIAMTAGGDTCTCVGSLGAWVGGSGSGSGLGNYDAGGNLRACNWTCVHGTYSTTNTAGTATWTNSTNCSYIYAQVWGGGGGGGYVSGATGGTGAYVSYTISTAPSALYLVAGGGGGGAQSGNATGGLTNGTASGGSGGIYGGAGGGYSGVFSSATLSQANALVVAGGGGGGANYSSANGASAGSSSGSGVMAVGTSGGLTYGTDSYVGTPANGGALTGGTAASSGGGGGAGYWGGGGGGTYISSYGGGGAGGCYTTASGAYQCSSNSSTNVPSACSSNTGSGGAVGAAGTGGCVFLIY